MTTWFIYDKNLNYAERLTDFFAEKEPLQIAMEAYSDEEALKRGLEKNGEGAVLIVTEESFREWMSASAERLALLTEDGEITPAGALFINRYQSAEGIWNELTRKLAEGGEKVRLKKTVNEKASLISFFNPQHRVLQTTFAMYYAGALSEKQPSLFLHFDGFGNLSGVFHAPAKKSLMDILYLWECSGEGAWSELENEVWKREGLHLLLSAGAPWDIHSVKEETWISFLASLQDMGRYASIILDLNEHVEGLLSILQMSGQYIEVHRPEDYEDLLDRSKLAEYERALQRQGMEELLGSRKVLRLPLLTYAPELPGELGSGVLHEIACNLRSNTT